jgi:nucleoside-diphosphate-sugar epimerase
MGRGRLVVIGAGDLGGAVAARWVASGGTALGITASPDKHEALRAAGVQAVTADERDPALALEPEDHVVLSIGGSTGQRDMARHLGGGAPRVRRAVFTGTTGVYGSRTGTLGPETPPGEEERAQTAAQAEAAFLEWAPTGVVIRFGGLYRAGRGPVGFYLRRGSLPPGPEHRPIPLVHRDDAATAILAALEHPEPDRIYVGAVPPLPTRGDFYREAARLHDRPAPSFDPDVTTGVPRAFDAARFLRDLLPEPAHPDWRDAVRG